MTASLPAGIGAAKAGIGAAKAGIGAAKAGIGAAKAGIGAGGGGHPALPGQRPAGATVAHLRLVPQPEGMLQIHTAPYRGSFATVLSQALRTAGLGSRVLVSQFLKGGVDQGLAASPWLCGRLRWLRPAVPVCLAEPAEQHQSEVLEAVAEVWQHSRQVLLEAAVDLLVLDELGLAMELGYVCREEVLDVLERRPAQMDVILTGPAMGPELMAMADQVTQLRRGL